MFLLLDYKKKFQALFFCVRHDLVLDDLAFNYLHAFGQKKVTKVNFCEILLT